MSGLVKRDLMLLWQYKMNIVFFLIIAVFLGLFAGDSSNMSIATTMLMVFIMVLSLNLFTVDESLGWDRYAIAMPVSKRAIVGSRYLVTLCCIGVALVVTFGVNAFSAGVRGTSGWLAGYATSALPMLVVFLLCNSVVMPVTYKFGYMKARFAMLMVYVIPLTIMLLANMYLKNIPSAESFLLWLDASFAAVAIGVSALAVVLYAGSFFLSVRIYTNKEY